MMARRDAGWRDLGASAALHGSLLGLALAFASATGPGPRLPGAPGAGEGPSGAPQGVFPVALLGGEAGATARAVLETRGSAGDRRSSGDRESVVAGERAPAPPEPANELRAAEASHELLPESDARPEPKRPSESSIAPATGDEPGGALEARAATSGRTAGQDAVGPEGETSASGPEAGPGGAGGATRAAGGGVGGAPGPGGSDLLPPSPLHIAVPALAGGLDPRRVRGAHVRLLVYVTESGDVSDVKVLSSSGIDKLDMAAESAARRLRYAPGSRAGSPVAMWTEAEIAF